MTANLLQILILGLVQGAAELLPVSSSAHVIIAEKLLGLDPSAPEMTFLLVMLHTGTMFAVIVYFWKSWRASYFASWATFRRILLNVVIATIATGAVGLILQQLIERTFLSQHGDKAEVELLFSQLPLIAAALFAAGLLIIYSGMREERNRGRKDITTAGATWIGIVQGLCLPFRGFSRSGATISTGLILGIEKRRAEEFSFALASCLPR
jgi:undecaprenyl-diphosphatase